MRTRNTFSKGQVLDFDDKLTPNEFYVKSHNGSIIYNNNGTFSWEPMKGTKRVLDINFDYGSSSDYRIIGISRVGDSLSVFSTDGTNSEIGLVVPGTSFSYQTYFNDKYDPNGDILDFQTNIDFQIRANGIKEDENRVRVYWNDNYNEPRVFNFALASEKEFVDGDRNPLSSTGKYPKFYSVHGMAQEPDLIYSRLNFKYLVGGELLSGYYKYFYQYETRDGYRSPFYPIFRPIFITEREVNSSNWHEYYMDESGNPTNKGARLGIFSPDDRFDKVRVGCIYFKAENQPDTAYIFGDYTIDGSPLVIDHTNNDGETISTSELPTSFAVVSRAQTQEIYENRYWLGNYETKGVEGRPDISSLTMEPSLREMNSDEEGLKADSFPLTNQATKDTSIVLDDLYDFNNSSVIQRTLNLVSDYQNYKGIQMHANMPSYFRGETYRFGLLVFHKKGHPWYVTHLGDFTFPQQYDNTYTREYLDSDGNYQKDTLTFGSVGDFKLTNQVGAYTSGTSHDSIYSSSIVGSFAINIMGIKISNIDITDMVDEISGVAVVRAKRDETIVHQGVMMNATSVENGGTLEGAVRPHPWVTSSFDATNYNQIYLDSDLGTKFEDANGDNVSIREYIFTYDSPDKFIDGDPNETEINLSNKRVRLLNFHSALDNSGSGLDNSGFPVYANFFSAKHLTDDIISSKSGNSYTPNKMVKLNQYNTISNAFSTIDAKLSVSRTTSQHYAIGHDSVYFVKMQNLDNLGGNTTESEMCFYTVNFYNNNKTPYGGVNKSSLENTVYETTGHFLPLSEGNKSRIKNGSTYELRDVEVFGGDCFPDVFSYLRLYPDNDKSSQYAIIQHFPIESKYNFMVRAGRIQAASKGAYLSYLSGSGFFGEDAVDFDNPEGHDYNSVLSTTEQVFTYIPYPDDLEYISKFPSSVRWSQLKILGESEDSFRIRKSNDFGDFDGQSGGLSRIIRLSNNIYGIQERGFSRIRSNDRASIPTSTDEIILGTGGLFDGVDYIDREFGCNWHFAANMSNNGIYYIDSESNKIMRFAANGLQSLSDSKYHHSFMEDLERLNGLGDDGGVYNTFVHYDPKSGDILFTFKITFLGGFLSAENKSLIYNEPKGQFVGTVDAFPNVSEPYDGSLFMVDGYHNANDIGNKVYRYRYGDRGEFMDIFYDSEIDFIVNPKPGLSSVFDVMKLSIDGDVEDLMGTFQFDTESVSATISTQGDDRVAYKEGILRFPLREKLGETKSPERLRGQKLKVSLLFSNFGDKYVRLASADTIYRLSRKV